MKQSNKISQKVQTRNPMVLAFIVLIGFFATQQVVAEEMSIAIVDQFAAILNTNVAQSLTEKYKVELEAERGKLVALDNEVAEMEGRLQKESEVMSQSEMLRLSSDIKDKQLDRNVLIKKLRNRNQDAQQEIVGALGPKFEEVMKAIQEERNFDLILQKQAALWASEKYDITQEVTRKINDLK